MKVIITGGSGYFGKNIINKLLNNGIEVLNIDLVKSNIDHDLLSEKLIDLLNDEIKIKNPKSYSSIIHLAGYANLEEANSNPFKCLDLNVKMTMKIVEFSVKNNINHFIYSSSMYALGKHGGFYGVSKKSCELFLREYCSQNDVKLSVIRVGSLFGGDSNESNGIHRYVTNAINKNEIIYRGTKNDIRFYIHVRDASNAVFEILKERKSGSYNLIGSHPIKIIDVFRIISEILESNFSVKYLEENSNKHYKYTPYNYENIDRVYDLKQSVDFGSGIIEVIANINKK